jgi:hypothetical protein
LCLDDEPTDIGDRTARRVREVVEPTLMLGRDPSLQHLLDLVVRHGVKPHDAPIKLLQTLIFRRRQAHHGGFTILGINDRFV